MEILSIAVDTFDPPAGVVDDTGHGRLYTSLIKRAWFNKSASTSSVQTVTKGSATFAIGTAEEGAVIAVTSYIKDNIDNVIPVTFVMPEAFTTALRSRILTETGVELSQCTVGQFMNCLIAQSVATPVEKWETFSKWFATYTSQLNSSGMDGCSMIFNPIGGGTYESTGVLCPPIKNTAELLTWVSSMIPGEMGSLPTSMITYSEIGTYVWFEMHLYGLSGDYESYTGRTDVRIAWGFRL